MNEIEVLRRVESGQISFDETDGNLNAILDALYDLHGSGYLQELPIAHLAFNSEKLASISLEGGLTRAGSSLIEVVAH
jgi:hypothetical protein